MPDGSAYWTLVSDRDQSWRVYFLAIERQTYIYMCIYRTHFLTPSHVIGRLIGPGNSLKQIEIGKVGTTGASHVSVTANLIRLSPSSTIIGRN